MSRLLGLRTLWDTEDCLAWMSSSDGDFSIASTYHNIADYDMTYNSPGTGGGRICETTSARLRENGLLYLGYRWRIFGGVELGNAQYYRKVGNKFLPYKTITVDPLGHGNFSTIQSAIDSVPSNNVNWISIRVKAGTYREKVIIPYDKSYIILKGAGKRKTFVEWNDHDSTFQSPTFSSIADNVVIKCMSFRRCSINVIAGALGAGFSGFITAQGRINSTGSDGFVFNNCHVFGNGTTYLGRPWRNYSRVLFYNTNMSNIVQPLGWDPWSFAGYEDRITFSEYENFGPGSNTSMRVSWTKKLDLKTIKMMASTKFIDNDNENWLQYQMRF
ncbi:unnamed protein product [Lupinus luteus]|uniref:Pectinesterase n=1 Tax=Lupinus luteus TaxID=3873 RepID=A0AAV1XA39_LUPLU